MKKAARKKKPTFFKTVEKEVKVVVSEEKAALKPQKKIFQRKSVQISGFVIVFIIIGILVYLQVSKLKDAPEPAQGKLSAQEVNNLVKEVGEKILIPEGETPTIATVTDISKLNGQVFFRNAKNGDKVMIFGSTKEAILYRPETHKIIAVAPINATDAQNAQITPAPQVSGTVTPGVSLTPSPTVAAKLKIVVVNSTKEVGLAKKGAALLDSTKFEITTANAAGEYDKTTISSASKTKKVSDSDLKSMISGFTTVKPSVSTLPSSESVEGADVIILLGKDFADKY